MKISINGLFPLLSFFLISGISCKKEIGKNFKNSAILQTVRNWYDNQTNLNPAAARTAYLNKLDWGNAVIYDNDNLVIVPAIGSKTGSGKVLAISYQETNKVSKGSFYIVFQDNQSNTRVSDIVRKLIIEPSSMASFKGSITNLTLDNKVTSVKKFGPSKMLRLVPDPINPTNLPIAPCAPEDLETIDWYLQTYLDGVLISETYLFSTVNCKNPTVGNSNEGYSTEEDLAADILGTMENNTVAVSTMRSATIDDEQPTTRSALYDWKCIQGKGWILYSIEKGVHEKVWKNNHWEWNWQSLTHQSMGKIGFVIGGEVTYQLDYAIPSLASQVAMMSLGINITMTTRVLGSPFSNSFTRQPQHSWNVNSAPFINIE